LSSFVVGLLREHETRKFKISDPGENGTLLHFHHLTVTPRRRRRRRRSLERVSKRERTIKRRE